MSDDEHVMVPHVAGLNIGIYFPGGDPMLVLNAVLPVEAIEMQLAYLRPDGLVVVPLAIAAHELQKFIPEIIESVLRARTITEMITTWPENREEIMKNIAFRWTGQMVEDDGDGQEG